mgnify:CR=1 FL=1
MGLLELWDYNIVGSHELWDYNIAGSHEHWVYLSDGHVVDGHVNVASKFSLPAQVYPLAELSQVLQGLLFCLGPWGVTFSML